MAVKYFHQNPGRGTLGLLSLTGPLRKGHEKFHCLIGRLSPASQVSPPIVHEGLPLFFEKSARKHRVLPFPFPGIRLLHISALKEIDEKPTFE